MNENASQRITADAAVLDVVAAWPRTQAVFRSWDERAGACILCEALFETVQDVAERFGLDLDALLGELREAAFGPDRNGF
jgi:hypothetical protein